MNTKIIAKAAIIVLINNLKTKIIKRNKDN